MSKEPVPVLDPPEAPDEKKPGKNPLDDWSLAELNDKFGLAPKPITNKQIDEDLLLPRIDDGGGEPPEPPEDPPEGRRLRDGDGEPMEFATGDAILAQQAVTFAQILLDTAKIQIHFSPGSVPATAEQFLRLCETYKGLTRRSINSLDQPIFPIQGIPPHFESQTEGWGNPVAGP